jgi:glycosyltransferase involved in cell wall biosynthesis
MYNLKIAVLLPCYNEALSIKEVINGFKKALPEAQIFVGDNNSTDDTAKIARDEGAFVVSVLEKGKSNVLKKLFDTAVADIYIMADGDATYDASFAPEAVKIMTERKADFINIARLDAESGNYRKGHKIGNWLLTKILNLAFGGNFKDMLSGYKVFSNKFVKSFAITTSGFGLEPEIAYHCLSLKINYIELSARYFSRKVGSSSKLSTYKDGLVVLSTIFTLLKEEKPLTFFSLIAIALCTFAAFLSWPILIEYFTTGIIHRMPTVIFILGLAFSALMCVVCGLVLTVIARNAKRQAIRAFLNAPRGF